MRPASPSLRSTVLIASCFAGAASCSPGAGEPPGVGTPQPGSGGRDGVPSVLGGTLIIGVGGGSSDAPPGCGDGVLTEDEACDDGNRESGDGCAANCRSLEVGWSCAIPGQDCIRIARCGDGIAIYPPELCDDGNSEPGDGCSPTCKIEIGYKCEGQPSVCLPTLCGDGLVEGAEGCDDDNATPFDGCSGDCQVEPDCSAGPCVSGCGDGLVLNEECDDGNNLDGDGCSADCHVEPGYTCTVPSPGATMVVPAVFRDFSESHVDFEFGTTPDTHVMGMVASVLGPDRKPTHVAVAGSNVSSAQSFTEWYRDVPGTNEAFPGTLTLYDNGRGGYVNRWGENGERYQDIADPSSCWCGTADQPDHDAEGNPIPCTYCPYDSDPTTPQCEAPSATACSPGGDCADYIECRLVGSTYYGIILEGEFDGDPFFFPVDASSFSPAAERSSAMLAPAFGGWMAEPGEPLHNFHFTSEVRYWFQYHAGQAYTLDFLGDDDVWVFINGRLAVDIGGIHTPVNGALTIDATGAAIVTYAAEESTLGATSAAPDLGLVDGSFYEIAVFHAERNKTLSSFQLTLDGFATGRSECTPFCGDGIVALGEECDDGVNDGGYGECGPDCRLGEFCGDGTLQREAGEECDDGNNLDGDDCGSNCRNIIIR